MFFHLRNILLFETSHDVESIYVLKPIMQVRPEPDNQASNTDAKEMDVKSLMLVTCYPDFFSSERFLMPEDNICQSNNALPNVHNALSAWREACIVSTVTIRSQTGYLYQYLQEFCNQNFLQSTYRNGYSYYFVLLLNTSQSYCSINEGTVHIGQVYLYLLYFELVFLQLF